ncbi:MAG TPA: M20/M25/M40 family metallo-hydrolase [Candidatus Binataceae bacterium]|nr:M20/M25/M40 family metallo-hydrolase [Candidatus Binataceae bacterium]
MRAIESDHHGYFIRTPRMPTRADLGRAGATLATFVLAVCVTIAAAAATAAPSPSPSAERAQQHAQPAQTSAPAPAQRTVPPASVSIDPSHKAARPEPPAPPEKPAPPGKGVAGARTPTPQPINWEKLTQEAAVLLSRYIRIDTTNPPGNELSAARMLREKFLADGIPATVWEPAPGRGVVAARLRGIGKDTKAIVLLSHMDVVPADPKQWRVPPFSGEVKDGEIWGRGAIDDKGPSVIELMAMLAIKRSGILLNRDILFVATGDEEEGGRNGAGWFVEHQKKIYADAGYLLNEGGGITLSPGGHRFYAVSIAEKTPMWIRLTAQGQAGHAAVPPDATALTHLVAALERLIAYRPPIRIINPVSDYFRAIAKLDGGPHEFNNLVLSLRKHAWRRDFLANARYNAMVRDTIAPTVLGASDKTNVISATAWAEVDCRLLPGEDPAGFLDKIQRVINDDTIKVDVLLNFPAVSSPRRSILMNAIDSVAWRDNRTTVVPTMIAGFTDSHYFRAQHVISYGFIPIELTAAQERTVHGVNERIEVKQLGDGIRRMVELLRFVGGS